MDRALTRREALRLGAGALALGVLGSPATARAAATAPALFELPIPGGGATAAGGWRTTRVLRAPRRFDLVGLGWAPGSRVEAQARARPRGGPWTAWVALPALDGHAPDGERAPAGTDPAFTGAADELQLRLRGSARELRARFVHALAAGLPVRASHVLPAAPPRARAAQLQGPIGPPAIIPRAAWGADSVPPRNPPSYGVVQAAFVHHTVGANDYLPEDSAAIVLGIARYHQDGNGWNDIGYNFLVDRYGQVFEGRAGGAEAAVIGAQAQGYNSQSTGIACLGTFTAVTQTEPGMDALARLIGWKLSLHGVPVEGEVKVISGGGPTNRYPSGTPVVLARVSGHRDGDRTACPGDALYAQLPELRARAAAYAGPVSAITVRAASRQLGVRPVALSGALRFGDGSSPAGAALSLEFAAAGAAWTQVTTTACGPDGSWATSTVLPASGQVRAVFGGDGTRPRVESGPLPVFVVPSMTLVTDKRRAPAGTPFAISGAMAPAQPLVLCLLERQVGSRWVTAQRKRIAVRGGRYATQVRPRKAGLYRVSIVADGVTRRRTLRARH